MFVGNGTPRKPEERKLARALRRGGMPYKRIAVRLGISASSAFNWTHDIELTPEQMEFNVRGPRGPQSPEQIARRAEAVRLRARERRAAFQEHGRLTARTLDPLHLAGCMLYWAEGAKQRNCVKIANSEVAMLAYFRRFLTECFSVEPAKMAFSLHVYLGNDLAITEIESHWLDALKLPRACLRKHSINPLPTSSSGKKLARLPYGVGTLSYCNTAIVQHIFGAIQEYAGFEEPRWLG